MPSTYAHYLFGKLVLEKLSDSQKAVIVKHRDLYDIGLHGPDILFYYQPFKSNPISHRGHVMHNQKGLAFFKKAREIASANHDSPEDMAYLFGFVCHFALDAKCHPYVEKYKRDAKISHTKIEVAFDKYLLEKEGIKPLKYHLSQHIHPSKKAGYTISPYFEGTSPQIIEGSLKSMNFYHHLLHASSKVKRFVLYTGMDLLHQKEFKAHVMPIHINPKCHISNPELDNRLQLAVADACLLIDEFEKNTQPLNNLYEHTFGEN